MVKINAREFALAVVTSSSPELSVEDKIKLYEDAYEAVNAHNKPLIEAEQKQQSENTEAFLKAMGRDESIFW